MNSSEFVGAMSMDDSSMYMPFILQVAPGEQRSPRIYHPDEVRGWYDEIFEYERRPEVGAWYEVRSYIRDSIQFKVLLNAHAFAEFEFDTFGVDPPSRASNRLRTAEPR